MTFGGELGSDLSGTTLQFLLGSEVRRGYLIILSVVLDLELARGEELDLGHHLVDHHQLEVDLALDLVHEVEGLHFVSEACGSWVGDGST